MTGSHLFVVIRTRGEAWQHVLPLEGQKDWDAHASFMNALKEEGFVVLGGPLDGTSDVLLVIRATPRMKSSVASRMIHGPA